MVPVAFLLVSVIAEPAQASPLSSVAQAAQVAADEGDRTGVAILDLTTGQYRGAGADQTTFPSESVVKVFIATELLLTGRMNGETEPLAYRMITASDDRGPTSCTAKPAGMPW